MDKTYMTADDHPLAIVIMALLQAKGEPFKATFTPALLNGAELGSHVIEYYCIDEGTDTERFVLKLVPRAEVAELAKAISDE